MLNKLSLIDLGVVDWDLSSIRFIKDLHLEGHKIQSFNFNTLESLSLIAVSLPTLALKECKDIHQLNLYLAITTLDLSSCHSLTAINVRAPLSTLDLSKQEALQALSLYAPVNALDLRSSSALQKLVLIKTQIDSLDLRENTQLEFLDLSQNPLAGSRIDYSRIDTLQVINPGCSVAGTPGC